MDFYKLSYDSANPVQQQVTVNTNTDFMVGAEVKKNGETLSLGANEIKLVDKATQEEFAPDKTVNGMNAWKMSAANVAENKSYDVNVNIDKITFIPDEHTCNSPAFEFYRVTSDNRYIEFISKQEFHLYSPLIPSSSGMTWANTFTNFEGINKSGKDVFDGTGRASTFAWFIIDDTTYALNTVKRSDANGRPCAWIGIGFSNSQTDLVVPAGSIWRFSVNTLASLSFGTPFAAKFDLNVVQKESSKGDIQNVNIDNIDSVVLSGTYNDGTEFSYEVLTK